MKHRTIRSKFVSLSVAAAVAASTLLGGTVISADNQDDTSDDSIVDSFLNAENDVDAQPMARLWFPDASAGLDGADSYIEELILGMAEGGFGGVEIAMIADETSYTNEQAKEIGWGTPAWNNVLKQVLKAAEKVETGFKVDITITSHWPPVINTIDPNDDEASTELSYQYTKITQQDLTNGTMELALPEQKTQDSRSARFLQTDTFTDAVIAQVKEVDSSGKLVLDFDSIENVSENVSVDSNGGYAAGIPDAQALQDEYGLTGADLTAALEKSVEDFGDEPTSSYDGTSKFDENGDRYRMADWQDEYFVDVSGLGITADNNTDIAAGDWVLVGTFYRGTGQVMSGGSVNTMANRVYATDYFDEAGIREVLDYWEENILSDTELKTLLQENGSQYGSSIFEDSIEASHSGPFWTANLLDKLDANYDYADSFAVAVAASSNNNDFTFDVDEADRIVEDYNLKLGDLYENEHAKVISDWAKEEINYNYRAQNHALTGLDIAGVSDVIDIPEGDNATSGDGLRNISSGVNMYDKTFGRL